MGAVFESEKCSTHSFTGFSDSVRVLVELVLRSHNIQPPVW